MRLNCILLAVALLSLSAVAADAPQASKLVGSWKSPSKLTMTFAPDGTFTQELKTEVREMSMSGTWKLEADKLTEICTKSNLPERVGKDHTMTVTKLTDDKLVLQDGPNKDDEVALDRVKD